MPSGRTSYSSHEEGIPHSEAHRVSRSRHALQRERARTIRIAFYALLILVNFAILSLFGPGGITGDLLRLLDRTAPVQGRTAVTAPADVPSQYPPGESWDNGVSVSGQSASRSQ